MKFKRDRRILPLYFYGFAKISEIYVVDTFHG